MLKAPAEEATMVRETKSKSTKKSAEPEQVEVEVKDLRSDVAKDIDDILGEIDEVLEENAQEFVQNYIQLGGE